MLSPRSMAHTWKEGCSISRQYFHLWSPQVTHNTVYLKAAGKTGPSTEVTSTLCLFQTGLENKLAMWLHFPEVQAEFTDCSKGLKTASLTSVDKYRIRHPQVKQGRSLLDHLPQTLGTAQVFRNGFFGGGGFIFSLLMDLTKCNVG